MNKIKLLKLITGLSLIINNLYSMQQQAPNNSQQLAFKLQETLNAPIAQYKKYSDKTIIFTLKNGTVITNFPNKITFVSNKDGTFRVIK